MYSKEVLKHFKRPKNYGRIKNPDGVGLAGNPVCGDVMKIYLKIKEGKSGKPFIKEIKFETLGCAAAIAVSSVLTERAKGKTLEEALQISNKDIAKALGGLPEVKFHCSLLGEEALQKAIDDFFRKKADL